MQYARVKVNGFGQGIPFETLTARLYAVGYVYNITIDQDQQIIAFDYATFRDKNGVLMELQKMRIACVESLKVPELRSAKRASATAEPDDPPRF